MSLKSSLMKRILMVGILCLMLLAVLVANVSVANDVHAQERVSDALSLDPPELVEGSKGRDASVATTGLAGDEVPTDGLVAYWSFDDGTATDHSGNGNDGTVVGASLTNGKIGGALSFDGSNDYVNVPHDSSLNPGIADFSVSFWMNTTSSDLSAMLNKRSGCTANSFWETRLWSQGKPLVSQYNSSSNYIFFQGTMTLNDGSWHHMAIVRQSNSATLYLDGEVDAAGTATSVVNMANSASLLIGDDPCVGLDGTQFYSGLFDEVRIYGRALSDAEIQTLYQQASPELSVEPESVSVTLDQGESASKTLTISNVGGQDLEWTIGAGYALQFDGADDYVNMGAQSELEVDSSLSLEAWIYPTGSGSSSSGGIIVNKEGEYEVARFADGTIQWAFAYPAPSWQWINTGFIAPLNQWTHIAVVYDSGLVQTYANGALVHTYNGSGNIGDFTPTLNDFRIGGRQSGSQHFQGLIEEVRVWDVPRSASEISDNLNRHLTGNEANLIGYWRFDEGAGSVTADRSANGNAGTINGALWSASDAPLVLMGRAIAASTFDANNEGWTIAGGASGPSYSPTGGNPDGYISASDAPGDYWYWQAPAKFLGDLSSAYKGKLSFDLRQSKTSDQFDLEDIILVGGGLTLVYDTPVNPGTTWTSYTVPLDETAGWKKDTLNGSAATQAEMLAVLSSLTTLRIRGEYAGGADTGDLDNVVLVGSNGVSVSPTSGTIAAGGSTAVTISVDTTNLTAGTYADTLVIASNDPSDPTTEVPLTLTVIEPVTTVDISGPTTGSGNANYAFTATVHPITATQPITYVWQATGLSTVTQIGGTSDTVTFNWSSGGQKTVSVTVDNGSSPVTSNHAITINSPPTANDDTPTVDEDSSNTLNVLANDSDPDGDGLTITAVGATNQGGSVTNNGTDITYTPAADFFGSESFTYTISDGNGESDTATVTITVQNVNDAPTANNDSATLNEDSSNNTIDVLANDGFAPDSGETLTISAVGTPNQGGSVTNNGSDITYTPAADFFGTEVFTYTISDGNGGTDTATVTITVRNVNDDPDAKNDSQTVNEDSADNTIDVLANDDIAPDSGESLIITAVGTPDQGGSVTNNDSDITYTPAADFFGTEVFTYTISDGNGGSDSATVTITVENVNDAPTANDDSATLNEDSANNTIDVLANDAIAPDSGETLIISAVGTPDQGGSVTNNGTDITYTPAANFFGSESFSYTISDGNGGTDSATVTITVNSVNDAPTADDDTFGVPENSPAGTIVGRVSATDEDGDSLAYAITAGAEGKFAINASTGQISLTTPLNFEDSPVYNLTVQVEDSGGLTDNATITVNVGNVSEPPISVAIDGPEIGGIEQNYTFTATVGSSIAKAPITYVWEATGLEDVTNTYNLGGLQDTVEFKWPITGTKTIMVTVSNASGSESDSQTITIENLPPVANHVRITPSKPDPEADPNGDPLYFVQTAGTTITVAYDYFDPDGNPQEGTLIRWRRGDQIEQQVQPILNEQETVPGTLTTISEELWCVTVTPRDGSLYGEPSEACVYIETIPNQVPIVEEADITENPSSSDPLEVTFVVSDTNDSGLFSRGRASGSADVEKRWYRNGVLQPAFNGKEVVSGNETNENEKWCVRLRAFDGTDFGPEKESVCQIISPPGHTLPIVKNLKITPEKPKDSDPLQVSYIFVGSGDSLRLGEGDTQIRWFRNGLIQRDLNNERGVPAELTAPGEKWWVTVRPHDGFDYGSLDLSRPVYIGKDENQQNTPPKVINVQIKPAEPRNGQNLRLSYDFIDPDGDPQGKETKIEWYKNLSRVPSLTSSVVEAKHTKAGDVWYAVVIPHDGTEYGLDVAAHSVTISSVPANNPPRALNVFLTPAIPGDGQDLQLYYLYDDKDGDLEGKSQIRWTRNFDPQPDYDDRSAIPGQVTEVGDTWCVMVRPYDGENYGSTVQANSCVKIQTVHDNTPPEATDPYISPARATSNDDLELHYEYSDADGDRERDTIINWYRNGTLQEQFNNETVIRASETSADDVWGVRITPHDGTDIGGKVRISVITINSPPEVVASIVPTVPIESHHLMLSYQFTDPDRDPESEVRIEWYKNGEHQKQYNGQKELPSEATTAGESWYAQMAVSDGLQFSEPVTTEAVTIAPIPLLYLPMMIRAEPLPDIPTPVPPTPVPPTPVPPTPVPPTPLPLDPFEENDTQETAYGALVHAKEYDALPNDKDDWYYFELTETSSEIYLQVRNYHGKGQLALYRKEETNREFNRVHIANDGRGERMMEIPNNMNPNALKDLRPGKYLVRVYTVDDYREDASYRYSLRVDYELR
ncbi:MAG: Ig-like domain-containing protein [Ardenticatenaceae bacterium]